MKKIPIDERRNCLAEARVFTDGGYGVVAIPYVTEEQKQHLLRWQERVMTELAKQQHRQPQAA
ncbi:hypothetical protein [Conchiformibius steedae]|uniref:hypothetical protein n=1 Tax=Conchiformibius steedae TaxID=153493 RepID=UPI0026E94219|nr:hypothetical protein [Conchiformibius steedae]